MKITLKSFLLTIVTIIVIIVFVSCGKARNFRQTYDSKNSFIHNISSSNEFVFLKAHLKNGDVIIFNNDWSYSEKSELILGDAVHYNFNRFIKNQGYTELDINKVALFETNKDITDTENTRIVALSLIAAGNIALSLYCAFNPKACFGSCPTFYLNEDDNFHYSDAEGFSNAILPNMEYSDIDAIYSYKPQGTSQFRLTMKNEAMETHCVNYADILAVTKQKNEFVYHSNYDKFYLSNKKYQPTKANAEEGNILELIANEDRKERFSFADSTNMLSKEEIYLSFENIDSQDDFGLLLNFRQTLMTTYLIYSVLDYMGDEISDYLAGIINKGFPFSKIEESDLIKLLGGIDVYYKSKTENKWKSAGSFFETGPIAINKKILKLENTKLSNSIDVKLVLNKGLWRIDNVALVNLVKEVQPERIKPELVIVDDKINADALAKLNDPNERLISLPGNKFQLYYQLPNNGEVEIFLDSKGYYLEWIRQDWLKEKNIDKLRQTVLSTKKYFKEEAKNYKEYEKTMEDAFWNSRIDKRISSNEK